MLKEGSDDVFLECEECMSGFGSVVAGEATGAFFENDMPWNWRPATEDEIRRAGLAWSILESD